MRARRSTVSARARASVARARNNELLTAATDISSKSAVSFADQSSASRKIRIARGRGARCWMAATYASSIVSRDTTATSGSSSFDARSSSRWSGKGCSHGISDDASASLGGSIVDGPRSGGMTRRARRASAVRQTFVAMR